MPAPAPAPTDVPEASTPLAPTDVLALAAIVSLMLRPDLALRNRSSLSSSLTAAVERCLISPCASAGSSLSLGSIISRLQMFDRFLRRSCTKNVPWRGLRRFCDGQAVYFGQSAPLQELDHRPGQIDLSAPQGKARGSRKFVVIIVQSFAARK